MGMTHCPGCGSAFEEREGPTHRYIESSPACWATYGEVLAREYSDKAYFVVHEFTADAYAVQHPGQPSPQTIQSVSVHLIRLCLMLEQGLDPKRANDAIKAAVEREYVWLAPPAMPGTITVADVYKANDVEQHLRLVRDWAAAAWGAWSAHHDTIRLWLPDKY